MSRIDFGKGCPEWRPGLTVAPADPGAFAATGGTEGRE